MSSKNWKHHTRGKAWILLECYKYLFKKIFKITFAAFALVFFTILAPWLKIDDLDELCGMIWDMVRADSWWNVDDEDEIP